MAGKWRGRSVLIVEDSSDYQELLVRMAEEFGLSVSLCDGGYKAFEHIFNHPVDLVISDIQMPAGSGLFLLKKMRDAGNQTPVLMITAASDISEPEALRLGASALLKKPFGSKALRTALGKLSLAAQLGDQSETAVQTPPILYFAYGSNMDQAQMKAMCPESKFHSVARLDHWELVFNKYSVKRNCVAANIRPQNGQSVWGVIFELSASDLAKLNKAEGGYLPKSIEVTSSSSQTFRCYVYIADPLAVSHLPSREYLDLLIGGAREFKLPPEYIAKLLLYDMNQGSGVT